ncbi:hypothetical protein [Nocardia sp. NPDC047654]|uniref:hypothetical protein n=1 Tax=Nocardia sp. NPDC047654 TaxID=3364314 RepID=UPI003720BD6E
MTDDIEFVAPGPLPACLLRLRCVRCFKVASVFEADPSLSAVEQIVAGGHWGRTGSKCHCVPAPEPPADIRAALTKALRLGTPVEVPGRVAHR